jgi:hypothetical protein
VFAAAKQYVQDSFDTSRNLGRVRANAQLIIAALKKPAEEGQGAVWAKLYHTGRVDGRDHKEMCFSVKSKVLKEVVEACGYRVYDAVVPEDAPTWPPRTAESDPEREGGERVDV